MEKRLSPDEFEDAGRQNPPRQLELPAQILRLYRPRRQERRQRAATPAGEIAVVHDVCLERPGLYASPGDIVTNRPVGRVFRSSRLGVHFFCFPVDCPDSAREEPHGHSLAVRLHRVKVYRSARVDEPSRRVFFF